MSADTLKLRAIILFGLLSVAFLPACGGGESGSSGSPLSSTNLTSGWAAYEAQCQGCHMADGTGTSPSRDLTDISLTVAETGSGAYTFDSLVAKINDTMPRGGAEFCEDDCAEDTAAVILCNFNPGVSGDCGDSSTDIVVPEEADLVAGQSSYDTYCVGCHRSDGSGSNPGRDLRDLVPYDYGTGSGYTFDSLVAKINDTMPPSGPVACQGDCAVNAASVILCSFDSEIAGGCP